MNAILFCLSCEKHIQHAWLYEYDWVYSTYRLIRDKAAVTGVPRAFVSAGYGNCPGHLANVLYIYAIDCNPSTKSTVVSKAYAGRLNERKLPFSPPDLFMGAIDYYCLRLFPKKLFACKAQPEYICILGQ